ncbi:hypothetical protein [Paenibacillus wynnii]|uniref:hypothetical protein n=1 Tax=Paenibacillus wynnii TaxID=268407 RepID=UPI0027908E4B|nr:hypothetical protein [Paenibacillus wynnii]MDQ0192124.1 hypothetical protein [Paenibacillus wynnii]
MIKKDDLDKLAAKLGPMLILPILFLMLKGITYLIIGATNLVEHSYQLGYSVGSIIEKILS